MEIKRIDEYTKEEKIALLNHWFRYYGKEIYILEELEKFQKVVQKDCDIIMQVAILSYLVQEGPSVLLKDIRNNTLDDKKLEEFKRRSLIFKKDSPEQYFESEKAFLEEVVTTYNHPEEDIPLSPEEFIRKLKEILNREEAKNKLTIQKVQEIFNDCLFKKEEFKDNKPTKNFTVGEGILQKAVFNTEKLNQHKPEIVEMIDEVENINQGVHCLQMCVRKDGSIWTNYEGDLDCLMMLGLATEVLEVPLNIPRDEWYEFFSTAFPYVKKNNEKVATPVTGNNPKDFLKIMKKK